MIHREEAVAGGGRFHRHFRSRKLILGLAAATALVGLAVTPARGQNIAIKYLGNTTEVFDGSQGYFAPHRACAKKFGRLAVWCTSEMIIQGGPGPGVPGNPQGQAWVNPAPVGAAGVGTIGDLNVIDFSTRPGPVSILNCLWWTSKDNLHSGWTLDPSATFVNRSCGFARPAACCGEVR